MKEERWAFMIKRIGYLSGYFTGWEIAGVLCIIMTCILLVLGAYTLFIYLLEIYRAERAQAAAAESFRARQDAMAPVLAAFRTVCYGCNNSKYIEEEKCAVCREDYVVGQELSCAPCEHAFHYQCLLDHMATSEDPSKKPPTCPLCRTELICSRYSNTSET